MGSRRGIPIHFGHLTIHEDGGIRNTRDRFIGHIGTKEQYPTIWGYRLDLSATFDSVTVRQPEIEQYYVWLGCPAERCCLSDRGGFADHFYSRRSLKEGRQPHADDLVIVDQQDTSRCAVVMKHGCLSMLVDGDGSCTGSEGLLLRQNSPLVLILRTTERFVSTARDPKSSADFPLPYPLSKLLDRLQTFLLRRRDICHCQIRFEKAVPHRGFISTTGLKNPLAFLFQNRPHPSPSLGVAIGNKDRGRLSARHVDPGCDL
jgi:hypothetical protein